MLKTSLMCNWILGKLGARWIFKLQLITWSSFVGLSTCPLVGVLSPWGVFFFFLEYLLFLSPLIN